MANLIAPSGNYDASIYEDNTYNLIPWNWEFDYDIDTNVQSFTIVLSEVGDKKINVIKEVRTATGLGLKEAKELVESAPKDIKEDVPKDEANEIKEKLEAAGAKVELKLYFIINHLI